MEKVNNNAGDLSSAQAGVILPHELVFVDLRTSDQPGYAQASIKRCNRCDAAGMETARRAGIGTIVECSTVGVGRRVDILKKCQRRQVFR